MERPGSAASERRRDSLLRIVLVGAAAGGFVLVLMSAAFPWYRMGGTLLEPQPGCTEGNSGFALVAAILALLAVLAIVPRDRSSAISATGLSGASVTVVAIAAAFGFLCADCGCTGGSGMTYGWLMALLGSGMVLGASAADLTISHRSR